MEKSNSRLGLSVAIGHEDQKCDLSVTSISNRQSSLVGSPSNSFRSAFGDATRWELIERNLREGMTYLDEQDRKLALAGALLDDLRKVMGKHGMSKRPRSKRQVRLTHEVFSCGLRGLRRETYRGFPLFDDGTSSPVKFHVYEDGVRKVVEVTRANLSGPALGVLVLDDYSSQPSEGILLEATRELIELRSRNHRQTEKLRTSHTHALAKLKRRRTNRNSLLGNNMPRPSVLKEMNNISAYVPVLGSRPRSLARRLLTIFMLLKSGSIFTIFATIRNRT